MGNFCNEYKRRVSYIFSYLGGCRDSNVGFAKAEVRDGYFVLNVTLCGVVRDTPEGLGIYLLFDRTANQQTYNMLPVGNVIVNCGKGRFNDIFNPSDIASSGYGFDEIKGIAVLAKNDNYYTCFSLWEADDIDPAKCVYLPKGYKKGGDCSSEKNVEINSFDLKNNLKIENKIEEIGQNQKYLADVTRAEILNVFDDDYYYDCVEVTPERLRELLGEEAPFDNSFVMHGFYTYRHLLFGRVLENENGTQYFVGVPGMYSNKERCLATMFGFNNFKKSHRSDYPNPYFGYWYMEV